MQAVLATLPPKVLLLSSDRPPEAVEIESSQTQLEERAKQVVARIRRATFTGKGDLDTVPGLFEDYVERIVGVLQQTLSLGGAGSRAARKMENVPMPSITVPAAEPMRLVDGQLLLLLADGGSTRAGGEGATQIGAVEGGRVVRVLGKGDAELSFDESSQAVLPWRPPPNSGQLDSFRSLLGRVRGLQTSVSAQELKGAVQAVQPLLSQLQGASPELAKFADAIRRAGSNARKLRQAVEESKMEELAKAVLADLGAIGLRRYGAGQKLTVSQGAGKWVDAEVAVAAATATHELRIDGSDATQLVLHPWNHAALELPSCAFEEMRAWWNKSLRSEHSHLIDALTGRPLDTLQ